jgi:hypothetical protein
MIPDVDHHQSFSFWDPWLQHYKRNFRHTWAAFSPLTFICLLPASEHLFGFSYGSILMSERISGRHALRHLYFYALLHSRRWLVALPSSCFRAPGNLHSLETPVYC